MISFGKEFDAASHLERKILQILSIYWEQMSASNLILLLKQLGIRTSEDKLFSSQNIAEFRKSFVNKGILHNTNTYGRKGFQLVDSELRETLTREASNEAWFADAVNILQGSFTKDQHSHLWDSENEDHKSRLMRDFRLCLYVGDRERLGDYFHLIEEAGCRDRIPSVVVQFFSNPFQEKKLLSFDSEFRTLALLFMLEDSIQNTRSTRDIWAFVKATKNDHQLLKNLELNELILKGEIGEAKKRVVASHSFLDAVMAATISLLEKNYEESVATFEVAINHWRIANGKRTGYPADWRMFLYGLALFKTDQAKFFVFAKKLQGFSKKNNPDFSASKAIGYLEQFSKNQRIITDTAIGAEEGSLHSDKIIGVIISAIIPDFGIPEFAEDFERENRSIGNNWFALEVNNLLALKGPADGAGVAKERADNFENELGFAPIGNLIPPIEEWKRAINALSLVSSELESGKPPKSKEKEKRIAWQIDFDRQEIQPIVQIFSKSGWTKGRKIALKKLFENKVKGLSEQDSQTVESSLKREPNYAYYGSDFYEFRWREAIPKLVGHPNLFLSKNPAISVHLTKSEPTLEIREIDGNIELSFDTVFDQAGCIVKKETETRYDVIEITDHHMAISESLKGGKLSVPAEGSKALLEAIQPLSANIAIQSDIEEFIEKLPLIDVDKRIYALVTPVGEGFHLEFFAKPFGTSPPYFKPGKGKESVITEIDGVRSRTKRDLESERKLLNEIERDCPFLADFDSLNYEWDFEDPESCLMALSELEVPRNAGKLVIEWTKGQKLKLLGNVGFENFSLRVKGNNNWFEVAGEVRVNEGLVLSMQELTQLVGQSKGGFVELSDGEFLAITDKLRHHLHSLSSVLDDQQRLHGLRSGILADFAEELEDFKANKAWKDHVAKLESARNFVPKLPSTFEAEFRPYQMKGYEWLSRLANWGVGACLADDMGLGKTLQALAILVERAEKGGALVVAPVSVCRNWVKEAMRFAPTLNFKVFGDGDRRASVEDLGKYDVLVTSYNLLQLEEKLFTKQEFSTIVLDEAQAIKNRTTKRSKTVMNLQGDFRLITTGTPIENHLGELWNLFSFINPGLLGSYQDFTEKFAVPIERDKDNDARKTLQRLIKPFILRRLKNQVLDDLPEKTEIKLTVEMSDEERAFYEAIRRNAIEKLEAGGGAAKNKRFRILAELTRLRLACCHPKLVDKNIPLGSSKLDLFGRTLTELLENKHKVLVFSQFVKHLAIVEEYLKNNGISYKYLDGSTPPPARQKQIDSFQAGDGEVFLISLRAGGTGLNLTAADYVIHLDPWWNPAVEDQATDRVHRIGQKRPVTVYRFVTENSVEEKILKLHETKRHLADSLLSESDSSGKLSAEDLMALIKEV